MSTLGPITSVAPNNYTGYWQPGWSNINGDTAPVYTERFGRTATQGQLARAFGVRGNRGMRRIMLALVGVAPGASAAESYTRIAAPTPLDLLSMGGVRSMEVFTVNSGVTTAAQVTYIQQLMARNFGNSITYPTDASGNGGGGKGGR